ncbi:MAG: DUF2062 domain-containing protein [Candidatus Nanoarchaeia archaeon]|nr:DUF2062 domain-containing protein [Candidatus Nanoarchaeia archaeon]
MNFITKLLRKIKNYLEEIIKIKQTPHSIASGFAIGTFISTMPTPGLNILLGVLISYFSKTINKLALFGGILFWNPLLTPITYSLAFKIGQFILDEHILFEPTIYQLFFHYSKTFLLGITILALITSIVSYLVVLIITYFYQKRNKIFD